MHVNHQLRQFTKDVNNIGGTVYHNLPPQERFRLVVQAEAASDQSEVERLISSCPRKTYVQRDAAVTDRIEHLRALALAFCVDLAMPLAKLQMLKAQASLLDYLRQREGDELRYAWWKGYTYGLGRDAPGDEDVDIPMSDDATAAQWFLGVNQRLIHTLEAVVLEQWEAFSQFSREDLALEPTTVLKSCMAPMLERVEEALSEIKGIEPDPAKVEEYRDIMGKMWRDWCGY